MTPSRLRDGGLPPMRGYARRAADRTGYTTPAGKLPSVTTILGATSAGKARLHSWLARPGAESLRDAAARRGTHTHTCIEHWITGTPPPRTFGSTLRDGLYGAYWSNIHPWLEDHFTSALAIEAPVWHPSGYSGTFDCLGHAAYGTDPAGTTPTLLDWKTAERERTGDLLEDYKCQLAAYRHAIHFCYGLKPDRALLVIARPHSNGPDVHEFCRDELDTYETEWFRRLHLYHHPQTP